MLTFDITYLFAQDIIKCFELKYPNFVGTLAPYRPSPNETEGLTVTVQHPETEEIYRISLCGRNTIVAGKSVAEYCVRLSQYRQRSPRYGCFHPIAKVDSMVKYGDNNKANIKKLAGHVAELLTMVKIKLR